VTMHGHRLPAVAGNSARRSGQAVAIKI
jgi:hypothetical protein